MISPVIDKPERAEDEQAVRKLIKQLTDAWNVGDGDAFVASFTEDADYTVWNGVYLKGREAIARGHQQIFDTTYKGTTNHMTVTSVRFLRPDVALVFARGFLKAADGEQVGTSFGHGVKPLFIMTKHEGRWRIDAFQNTPVIISSD